MKRVCFSLTAAWLLSAGLGCQPPADKPAAPASDNSTASMPASAAETTIATLDTPAGETLLISLAVPNMT